MKFRHCLVGIAFALLAVCLFSNNAAASSNVEIPEDVLEYAKTTAFSDFLELNGSLKLTEPYTAKDLMLGEGFVIHAPGDLEKANTVQEYSGNVACYYFVVEDPVEAVSSIQVYESNGDLVSGGGAESSAFYASVLKMRELIQKAGSEGDVSIVQCGFGTYYLYHSFFGDERVIYVAPPNFFDQNYLTVRDYRELPTGDEALAALRESAAEYQKAVEKAGGMPVYGGPTIHLSLHKPSFPKWIWIVIAAAVSLALVGTAFIIGRRKRR
ncbi:MAG: hypothetical protein J6Y95_02140 [Lachnospiraceae bacterium]|nr:hypothetical protein [Lachnospiraceae bacterium]